MELPTGIISSLLNFGAMGVLASVLLYLHLSALRTIAEERASYRADLDKERASWQASVDRSREIFSQELKNEREQCAKDHERMMATMQVQHEAVMRSLGRKGAV